MSENASDTTVMRFPEPATVPDQRPRWEGWETELPVDGWASMVWQREGLLLGVGVPAGDSSAPWSDRNWRKRAERSDRSERQDECLSTQVFSVNYAMVGCIIFGCQPEQIGRESGKMTHILRLPPGSVVTFTKLCTSSVRQSNGVVRYYAPTVVEHPLLSTALRDLLLLLLFDLGGLGLDFASTGEGSVNYTVAM